METYQTIAVVGLVVGFLNAVGVAIVYRRFQLLDEKAHALDNLVWYLDQRMNEQATRIATAEARLVECADQIGNLQRWGRPAAELEF